MNEYQFSLRTEKILRTLTVTKNHETFPFKDVFVCQRTFPRSYRAIWFRAFHPSLEGKRVLDLCGDFGEWGAYLQAVDEETFHYTLLDAGIYFKSTFKKFMVQQKEDYESVWTLTYEDMTLAEQITIPEVFAEGVKHYFKELGINGEFILHTIETDTKIPLCDNSFDLMWMFGWWAWPFDMVNLLEDVKRVLKLGGYFLFDMPSMEYHNERKHKSKIPIVHMTKKELKNLLLDAGLKIKRLDMMPTSWTASYKKTYGVVVQCPK